MKTKYQDVECECPVCKELNMTNDITKITELYEPRTGYFFPMTEMIIRYCPFCGNKMRV